MGLRPEDSPGPQVARGNMKSDLETCLAVLKRTSENLSRELTGLAREQAA